MEQSDHTTPQSLFVDVDGVPSWITSEAVYTLNFRNLLDADGVKILSQ